MADNFKRMLQLADEVFAVKQDPEQLDVDETVLKKLRQLHPASVSERSDNNGPYCWILLIPTTRDLMNDFISGKISEKELYNKTPVGAQYDCIYLCSAMVLEEYRRKGIARQATLDAIRQIRAQHPIACLFVWPFSREGDAAAKALAGALGLPLLERRK